MRHITLLLSISAFAQLPAPLSVPDLIRLRADTHAASAQPTPVTMAPAQWTWIPSNRTLPNTFALFRKEITLDEAPVRAVAWLTADSRYQLSVNGRRVQWGPAPCDPRQLDVDPCDLTPFLVPGRNVIGAEVLFYGYGDGTWPAGKPGFIFHAFIEYGDGRTETVVSDPSWQVLLDRAHRPGQFKRWYLRSLQEEFDARLHPVGWDTPDFSVDTAWMPAAAIDCPPDKPAACGLHESNDTIDRANPDKSALRARQIPAVLDVPVPAERLADQGRVTWMRDPDDWFHMQIPKSFEIVRADVADERGDAWQLAATTSPADGVFATFEFTEQIVGCPYFTIDAPEGTIVELMIQEGHDLENGPLWLDTHLFSWTRFICREGINRFQTFDYESARWMQLHIRNASRPVTISDVGIMRRMYPWPHEPHIICDDPALQRLFNATINTIYNSAIETYVDGMGRERQQYSADGGVQIFTARYALGDNLLARRYLRTFSEGQSPDGYFMDCWPAFDRLARVSQKQIDGAYWGPLLDHGVSFVFDNWWHYLYSGDLDGLAESYPRLVRFGEYLETLRGDDGLLPTQDLGIPTVWIDHDAYKQKRHNQCAFNLFTAAMFKHALAPICRAKNEPKKATQFETFSDSLLKSTIAHFWSNERNRFEANLPWQSEEGDIRLCDRSLATSILFDQCPPLHTASPHAQTGHAEPAKHLDPGANTPASHDTAAALKALVECPPELGLSYPANAYWRYWALAKLGRADVIVKDWRERWATMPPVILNNTLGEWWSPKPDSNSLWSHCPVSPVYVLFMDIAGIRPTSPGFDTCVIRPQLAGMGKLELTAHTPHGPIQFRATPETGGHRATISLPVGCQAELAVPHTSHSELQRLDGNQADGLERFRIAAGSTATVFIPQ